MWLGHSAAVCLVIRSDAASIGHVRERAKAVEELCGGSLFIVVIGNGPYSVPEIKRFIGVHDIIEIADDPRAAAVLTERRGSERRLARSALVKSARRLAHTLVAPESETPSPGGEDSTSLGDMSRFGSSPDGEGGEPSTATEATTLNRSLSLQDQQ
jgi:hypothetical protein